MSSTCLKRLVEGRGAVTKLAPRDVRRAVQETPELEPDHRFRGVDLSDASTLEISGSWLNGPVNPGYLMLDPHELEMHPDEALSGNGLAGLRRRGQQAQ